MAKLTRVSVVVFNSETFVEKAAVPEWFSSDNSTKVFEASS